AVGSRHRVEAAGPALVLDAQRAAKERPYRLAGNGGELVHEGCKIDRRHELSPASSIGECCQRQSACCRSATPGRTMATKPQRAERGAGLCVLLLFCAETSTAQFSGKTWEK